MLRKARQASRCMDARCGKAPTVPRCPRHRCNAANAPHCQEPSSNQKAMQRQQLSSASLPCHASARSAEQTQTRLAAGALHFSQFRSSYSLGLWWDTLRYSVTLSCFIVPIIFCVHSLDPALAISSSDIPSPSTNNWHSQNTMERPINTKTYECQILRGIRSSDGMVKFIPLGFSPAADG